MEKTAHVYIMSSHRKVLYIGVTTEFAARVSQHKSGRFENSFTSRYKVDRLVYYETYSRIVDAIAREKQLKGWRREKKLNLIRTVNPEFKDLAEKWGWKIITRHERMNP